MATINTKQLKSDKKLYVNLAVLVGSALTIYFLYSVAVVMQGVRKSDMLDSPSTLAALPSVLLAVYIFAKSRTEKQRYVAVAITISVVVAASLWLLGVTSVGDVLSPEIQKSCSCVNLVEPDHAYPNIN